MGDAALGDEAIGEAEGAQPGGVGNVPLRPVGKVTLIVLHGLEIGLQKRGGGEIAFADDNFNHVLPQCLVELFPVPPGVCPGAGWYVFLGSI